MRTLKDIKNELDLIENELNALENGITLTSLQRELLQKRINYINEKADILFEDEKEELTEKPAENLPVTEAEVKPTSKIALQPSDIHAMPSTGNDSKPIPSPVYSVPNPAYMKKHGIPKTSEYIPQNKTGHGSDIEKFLGKNIMAVVASALIFISLILFAVVVVPFMGDEIKMLSCFIFSFALTGVGFFALKKNRNGFNYSISACGLGCLYISIFLSNLYFKMTGDIFMYVMLLFWAVVVCVISRVRQELIFKIIGYTGLTISVIFGSATCYARKDSSTFLLIVLYFMISYLIFYILNFKKEYSKMIIDNQCAIISALTVMNVARMFNIDSFGTIPNTAVYIICILYSLVPLVQSYFISRNDMDVLPGIINCESIFALFQGVYFILPLTVSFGGILYVLSIILLLLTEFKFKEFKYSRLILRIFLTLASICAIYQTDIGEKFIGLGAFIVPAVIYAIYSKDEYYIISSAVLTIFFAAFVSNIYYKTPCLLLVFVIYAVGFITEELYYKDFLFPVIYLSALIFLIRLPFVISKENPLLLDSGNALFISFSLSAVINAAFYMLKIYKKQHLGKEKSLKGMFLISNAFFMLYGLSPLQSSFTKEHIATHIIITIVLCGIYSLDTLIALKKESFGSIYVGLKYTLLIFCILLSFEVESFIISIVYFVFALAIITAGFKYSYKYLRVYGLIVSVVSVAKLILIDITYNNTLMQAFSFLICGVLCFIISYMYYIIEKKTTQEQKQ